MMRGLKRMIFSLLGKDPEAVIVSYWSGEDDLALRMIREVLELVPDRRHFVVTVGPKPDVPGTTRIELAPADLYLQLRRALRRSRIGLSPVLFSDVPHPLRSAAFLIAPTKVLAYNHNLERHHLHLDIASLLFRLGVPLDRIHLRPTWLCPWKKDRTRVPDDVHIVDGRPLDPSRRRIAVLSPYFPYPLAHGGAVRIYNLLRESAAEFDIFLFAFAKNPKDQEYAGIIDFCAKVVAVSPPYYREPRWSTLNPPEVHEFQSEPMRREFARVLREHQIELIQVEYTQMASYRGDILVEHDVTFDLYRQVLERTATFTAWWNHFRWKRYEQKAVRRFKRAVVMSTQDAQRLPGADTRVIENGVDLTRFRPEPERPGMKLLFVGSFNHFPNVEAFRFFYDQVWPTLRTCFRDIELTVVAGKNHLLYWRQFAGQEAPPAGPGLGLLDFVRDVRPLYVECNLVIVPTTVSAGTNLKVLEAMAMERAVVSTTRGCAGLGLRHGESVWIADDPTSFADGVSRLIASPEDRARMAQAARVVAEQNFDWKQLGAKQRQLYRELLG